MRIAFVSSVASAYLAVSVATAVDIYAVNHLGQYPNTTLSDTLIRFDSTNPAGYSTIGSLGQDNIGFGGLDFDRDGNLWAYALYNKTTGGASTGLYKVNTSTGAATLWGTRSTQTLSDLAYNPVDDTMYGVFSQGYAVSRLYRVDLNTGLTNLVGTFSGITGTQNLAGLAFDSDGNMIVYNNVTNTFWAADANLNLTLIYDLEPVAAGSQGITIDWSRSNLGYHAAVGQGDFPNYYSTLNTFAVDGSAYTWGPSFGPNFPDGLPPVQAGDLAISPALCLGDIADDFGLTADEGGGPDGVVDFGDFAALLGLIGPCDGGVPGCLGDIADDFGLTADEGGGPDGVVDFGDFAALLGLIGPCS